MTAVYALRYARRTESQRGEHFYGHVSGCCGRYPIDYFTWVILTDDRTIVVDAGFTPETAKKRGNRIHLGSPIDMLSDLDRRAEDVTDVIITHLHYDHTGYAAAYPNARLWLQRAELDFWTSPISQRGGFVHLVHAGDLERIRSFVAEGRVTLLEGDADLGDGVSLHLVGGHTPGMQVVRVAGGERPVVLASDASHFYANLEEDHPYGIVYDLGDMYRAFDRLAELKGENGVIVPGHDPRVAERHAVMHGSAGMIFRLDS